MCADVENPAPDSTVSAGSERIQYLRDESWQVVSVSEESLRRASAETVPGLPGGQEVVLVDDDCRSAGAVDRSRKVAREGRLARPVNTIYGDHCGVTECIEPISEAPITPIQGTFHHCRHSLVARGLMGTDPELCG